MAHHKLLLDEDINEDFSLIAIHCSEEAYKVAFFLNKCLNLQLKRMKNDLDFSNKNEEITYPVFEFTNKLQYTTYYLLGNKSKQNIENTESGLFSFSEKTITNYLLPEFKEVDFFLKVESDIDNVPLRKNVTKINEIKEVISAYLIENEKIKLVSNLILN